MSRFLPPVLPSFIPSQAREVILAVESSSIPPMTLLLGNHSPLLHKSLSLSRFGVLAKGTADTKRADPTALVVLHQADLGEYLRHEDTLT